MPLFPFGQARNSACDLVKNLNVQTVQPGRQKEGDQQLSSGDYEPEDKKSVEVIIST